MSKETFVGIVLMILLVGSLALCVGFRDANALLIQINKDLLNQPSLPQPVRNAEITPIYNHDGSITLIINGYHTQVIPDACRRL